MQDYILRAIAGQGSVRIFAANTKNLVGNAAKIHQSMPAATVALGRTLTAAAMMGATLKNDTDVLTIDIRGNGPLGGVFAVANSKSQVKGYTMNPLCDIPRKPNGKTDVSGAIGIGVLTVTKDMGLKEPVSGQVELVSGEIAEDITYYFDVSEQTPSGVTLGVLVDRDYSVRQAGGIILQLMPDAKDEIVARIEKIWPTLPAVTTLLEEGRTVEDMLYMLFDDVEILDTIYPEYACNCSREKTAAALKSVGFKELRKILEEDKGANMHCHFCDSNYVFEEQDIMHMIAEYVQAVLG